MNRRDEQWVEGNSSCLHTLRKLRPCAMEMAELENTRAVLTRGSVKENVEG